MTYTVVPDKAVGDIFSEVMWDTSIKDNLNKGLMRPFVDTILVGTTASFTFNSIPSDWASLLLVTYLRGDSSLNSQSVHIRFNGDTGANYDWINLDNQGGVNTLGSQELFAQTGIRVGQMPAALATANVFGGQVVLIPNYDNASNHKPCIVHSGWKFGTATGNVRLDMVGGIWRSTSAITSLTVFPGAGNFVTGGRMTLYGVGE